MEIQILDENFQTLRRVSGYNSLDWTEKWFSVGTFLLDIPDNYSEIYSEDKPRYIYNPSSDYLGRVDNLVYEYGSIIATGSFLEGNLNEYVDYTRTTYSGNVESVARNIVLANCINSTEPMPGLILGNNSNQGGQITASIFGKSIGSYLYDEIAKVHENSYNIKYNIDTQKLEFKVIWGKNRTQEQTVNDYCIFSRDYGNVSTERFETNLNYPNYTVVYGEGEGTDRVSVIVDIRKPGEQKREIPCDARDLRSEGLTTAQYKENLRQRGLQRLAEQGKYENLTNDVSVSQYMPYNLGDIVAIQHSVTSKIFYKRITERRQVIQESEIKTQISFGERQGGIMTAIERS